MLRDRFDPRYFERDVLFRYHAGWAGISFSRASGATLIDRTGTLREVGPDVPRIEWLDLDGDGRRETPVLRLERARTNALAEPWNFAVAPWTLNGPATLDSGLPDPFGGARAFRVTDTDSNPASAPGALTYSSAQLLLNGPDAVLTIHVQEGDTPGPGGSEIGLWDQTAGVWRGSVLLTWQAGAPVASQIRHGATDVRFEGPLVDSAGRLWYRMHMTAHGIVAGNEHRPIVQPCDVPAETGDLHLFGAGIEDGATIGSSYIDDPAALTRASDLCTVPLSVPWQALALYARTVEAGTAHTNVESTVVALRGDGASLRIRSTGAGVGYSARLVVGAAGVNTGGLAVPAIGQTTEHLLVLTKGGAFTLYQSIDGGPVTSRSHSGLTLPSSLITVCELNALTGFNAGLTDLRDLLILRGASWTMDDVRRVAGIA